MNIDEITKDINNLNVFQALIKADNIINRSQYNNILCSISGGSDSDIMLDICHKVDKENKIKYIWFDTGIEYQATKNHLKYLESRYNIEIIRAKAIKPIPTTCKEYGQPFLNKYVSQQINRLQNHNFNWENQSFDILKEKYPDCVSAIKWWTNEYTKQNNFEKVSSFDIGYNKHLKEFILKNPPKFKVSSNCCKYAKKDVAKKYLKEHKIDLNIYGVRRAEGGIRSQAYKNCFTFNSESWDEFRPLFYLTDEDKRFYENHFDIIHSDCYKEYGMKRTGCCGCPYNRELQNELYIIEKYEPKLFKGMNFIFKDSYEYTKKYREFYNQMQMKKNQMDGQISLFEI